MKPRIKIIPRKQASVVTDAEIEALMNFDGLVQSAGQLTLWTKMMGHIKLITGGLAVVTVSSVLVWVTQDNAIAPPENQPLTELPVEQPHNVLTAATDSVVPTKEVPVQRLPAVRVAPKKPVDAIPQKAAVVEPVQPAPPATTGYKPAEPVEGFIHLNDYFSRELAYPAEALQDSVQGVSTVIFTIDRNGQVGKISVLNSLGPLFDAEIAKLIHHMPAWKPATVNGQPVTSMFSIQLNFQVELSKQ